MNNVLTKENMKKDSTYISDAGRFIGGLLLIMTVVFIWILIDAGNVYAQTKQVTIQKIEASEDVPAFRNGADRGNVIDDPLAEQGFEIYPNPSHGSLVFDFEFTIRSGDVETSIDVYDAMGRMAYHTSVSEETIETGMKLDLGTELPGNYLVVIRRGDQVFTKRFLKI
ncbi:MAG: hypothetical protein ACI9FU_001958 [Granulosicoccus sp.]|jgi:hypothetical protein